MGVCYSSFNRKREREHESGNSKADFKLKKISSGDFAALISKLSGGGAAVSAAVSAEEQPRQQISGRLISNGSTRISSLYTQQGKKGTNQDAMIIWENFGTATDPNATFCGVFDGHGPYGHMVARKVRDTLPNFLHSQWEKKPGIDQTFVHENGDNYNGTRRFDDFIDEDDDDHKNGCESIDGEGNDKVLEMDFPLKKSILKAFKLMDKELKSNRTIDCFCSGTTAVTLIMQGRDLIIGNVGDSRAILATRDKDNALVALQLTVDLKPNLPREAARIQKCKGRVFAMEDEPEIARVWLPNRNSPGLAMARAFGDFCLKDFGLISIPDVYYHHITERDEFVILASDGVWDVLSNKEAVDIVTSTPSRATAARALVDCATRAWRLKYPTSKNDDCAVVCLFLDQISVSKKETKSKNIHAVASPAASVVPQGTTKGSSEIVPVVEEFVEKPVIGQSKRSLAECLSIGEDEEWSALEGISRVNSLLSLPRLNFDKRSTGWRKW